VEYGKDTADQGSVKELVRILHPQSRAKQFEPYSPVSEFNLLAAPR